MQRTSASGFFPLYLTSHHQSFEVFAFSSRNVDKEFNESRLSRISSFFNIIVTVLFLSSWSGWGPSISYLCQTLQEQSFSDKLMLEPR